MGKKKIRFKKRPKQDSIAMPVNYSKFLAIILKEDKSTVWFWVPYREKRFECDGHTYFKDPNGVYMSNNQVMFSIYMEGVSMPIAHDDITITHEETKYVDPNTRKEVNVTIPVVGGIKWNSEIANAVLDRQLADEFTKKPFDAKSIGIYLLLIGIFFIGFVNLFV